MRNNTAENEEMTAIIKMEFIVSGVADKNEAEVVAQTMARTAPTGLPEKIRQVVKLESLHLKTQETVSLVGK